MDIDYFGTLYATKAVVPTMIERKSGHIVNFSSVAGFLGVFGYTAYTPTKFAVRGFSESLRQELKPHGVHVSVVFPPDTDTPQLHYENQFKPPETRRITGTVKAQTADQVAEATVRSIERHKTYITPGFDPWLYFLLFNGPIDLFHWYCDCIVARVRREREGSWVVCGCKSRNASFSIAAKVAWRRSARVSWLARLNPRRRHSVVTPSSSST